MNGKMIGATLPGNSTVEFKELIFQSLAMGRY